MNSTERLHGLLLGTAIGDAVGLPAEGLSPRAISMRGWNQDWQHHFLLGRGMWSDDTEHTLILAQALNRSNKEPQIFQNQLSKGLRHWFLLLPAGVGFATARSLIKLWLGISPRKSGVFSAGNGPCMRAALLGVVFQDEPQKRKEFNYIHTHLTHTDPKAEYCSRAVVELAALFSSTTLAPSLSKIFETITFNDADANFRHLLAQIKLSLEQKETLSELLKKLGGTPKKGVSGYCFHTLAAVLYCGIKNDWLPETALPAIWNAGGDSDTTGAILGALCGTLHGPDSFPAQWKNGLAEWPVTIAQFPELAQATIEFRPKTIRYSFHPLLLIRNILFLITVLTHTLLRLVPRPRLK